MIKTLPDKPVCSNFFVCENHGSTNQILKVRSSTLIKQRLHVKILFNSDVLRLGYGSVKKTF